MFIDSDRLIYKDILLSYSDIFLEEYSLITNVFQYPEDIHNGKWVTSPILNKGKWYDNHVCQRSLQILKNMNALFIASYSILKSGAIVKPHVGFNLDDPVFRVHLPLIVPKPTREGVIVPDKDCWLRVGGETKTWKTGELLVFDDTVEHEVQNNTEEDRVILLMDFMEQAFTEV
jgi:aspartyl/asparaginyl beta-hydroxylase (cupin superfamily)